MIAQTNTCTRSFPSAHAVHNLHFYWNETLNLNVVFALERANYIPVSAGSITADR